VFDEGSGGSQAAGPFSSEFAYIASDAMNAAYMAGRREALGEIHVLLNGVSWSPDTLDRIAELVVAAGFKIAPPVEG
jgi:hypothetical protein